MFLATAGLPDGSRHHHDVVVVGAGAAGITLAGELSDVGIDVAVVEGGARTSTPRSQQRYQGPLALGDGLTYPALDQYRLRWFGGTTNHWGGWCRPLDTSTMAPRPGVSDGWPYGRDELDAWYEIAHRWCEIGRPEYRLRQLGVAGRELADLIGDRLDVHVLRLSRPTRFGEVYASRFDDPVGPTAYLEANCISIEMSGDRTTGVVVRDEVGGTHVITGERIVIACGGIETVRQLLLMQQGGLTALGRSGLLGVGFHEHPHRAVGSVLAPAEWLVARASIPAVGVAFDRDTTPYRAAFALPDDIRADLGLPQASFMLSNGTLPDDPLLSPTRRLAEAAADDEVVPLSVVARAEQRLDTASTITLSEQKDDLGLPRAALRWAVPTVDIADLQRSRDLVMSRLFGTGLGPAVDEPDGPRRLVTGGAHHMGGVRLHESPDHGVVDPDLRCHGTANLYACSSAVFPPSGWSNPTLTIVALAAKLAAHLAGIG